MIEPSKKAIWLQRTPMIIVSVLSALTLYASFWASVKILGFVVSHYRGVHTYYVTWLFGRADGVSLWVIPFVMLVSIVGWILSTRVPKLDNPIYRILIFFNMLYANAGIAIAYGMTKVQDAILPFFYERLNRVIETSDTFNNALFGQTQGFFFLMILAPLLIFLFIVVFIMTKYRLHDEHINREFVKFKWRGERYRLFEEMSIPKHPLIELPDVPLGLSIDTKEMISIPGQDRTLNNIIIGSIGTGKTSALALPQVNSDLHNFTRFLNDFEMISAMDNYKSEEVQGRYLNGISIIEPSNDFCQKVYQLAKAHNIPDSAITYIDPTNPETTGINCLRGPTDKASEMLAQVIAGLADSGSSGNFYFEQAQRIHLKQYVYLLKMHDPELDAKLDDLIVMYDDAQKVRKMHLKLKARIPSNFEEIKDRDEYNYWRILKSTDKWFDKMLIPLEVRTPQGPARVRGDDGEIVYIDAGETDVKGLRNILADISNNQLLSRVLFGESKFDFDDHMNSAGGLLLVNTSKGELGELGKVLGKIVLMSLQNATFRRPPNISTFHSIFVDEAPEYLYSDFSSFPSQSRKYKVIITILHQTLTQMRGAYGEDYMNTLVSTMRNRMVYGDVSSFDAKYFAEMFGEKENYVEGQNEQAVSPLQEDPVSRTGSTYQLKKEAALSASDILYQGAFECAVKIVVDNQSMPVQQIKANFVSKKEFKKAIITVKDGATEVWEKARFGIETLTTAEIEPELEAIDGVPVALEADVEVEKVATVPVRSQMNEEVVKQAVTANVEERPVKQEIVYEKETVPAMPTIQYESTKEVSKPAKVSAAVPSLDALDEIMIDMLPTRGETSTEIEEKAVSYEQKLQIATETQPKPLETVKVVVKSQPEEKPKSVVSPLESVDLGYTNGAPPVEPKPVIETAISEDGVVTKRFNKRPKMQTQPVTAQMPTANEEKAVELPLEKIAEDNTEIPKVKEKRSLIASKQAVIIPQEHMDSSSYKQEELSKDVQEFANQMGAK